MSKSSVTHNDAVYNHQAVKTLHQSLRTWPKEDWLALEKQIPLFRTDDQLRRLAGHLALGPHQYDDGTGYIRIGHRKLAHIAGEEKGRRYRTGALFERFQEHVPAFQYRDYYYQGEKERAVMSTGLFSLFDQEYDPDRVYIDTLRHTSERRRTDVYRDMLAELEKAIFPYAYQKKLASYLNSNALGLYTSGILNFEAALTVARKLDATRKHPLLPVHTEMLYHFLDAPKPVYFPSQKYGSRTPRFFGTGLPFINSAVRQPLFPEWIDLDIANCQLALIAALFHIDSAMDFLATGQSIWPYLMTQLGLPEEVWPLAKPQVKIALYSLIYGKPIGLVCMELYASLGWITRAMSFARIPLVEDIGRAIVLAKKSIEEKNGMEGAFGWMVLGETDIESFLACSIQTYELVIIGAVYDLAIQQRKSRNEDFVITLHQHDGISIMLRQDACEQKVLNTIEKAIRNKAAQYGISASIQIGH